MTFFDGIEWVGYNHVPECRSTIKKYLDDYFVLDYNHAGALRLTLDDDQPIHLKSPVVWFTFPGPLFSFGPEKGSCWDHRHISFRGPRVEAWRKAGLIDATTRHPVIPLADPERFARHMDDVMEYLSAPVYGAERAVQMFEGLLLQLHEQGALQPAVSPTEKKVSEFISQVDREPEACWSFRHHAHKLGVSYSHFRLVFRNLTGLPPCQYMTRQRMSKAARLLRKDELEIKEIAGAVGYEDIFHFAKVFKKHFGTPPGRFRARSTLK